MMGCYYVRLLMRAFEKVTTTVVASASPTIYIHKAHDSTRQNARHYARKCWQIAPLGIFSHPDIP